MKHPVTCGCTIFLILCTLFPTRSRGRVLKVPPGKDYRSLLQTLEPGDELVFLPGKHVQHASVNVAGTEEQPIVIRGRVRADGRRPEIRWTRRGRNTWDVRGKHLQIRDLAFHSAHHYGVRIRQGSAVTIQNCLFRSNGGGDLSVNSGRAISVHVFDCRFIGGKRTPVYVGNHAGKQTVKDFRFERNVVDGSQIDEDSVIGYGVQLKLNVDGVIRNNFIRGTQGPAIMVYGFEDAEPDARQLIENNITVAARRSPNIVIGGGPVTARGNLVLAGRSGGIHVIDYEGRDLLDAIILRDNLLIANHGRSLSVNDSARDPIVAGNRPYTLADKSAPAMRLPAAIVSDIQVKSCPAQLAKAITQLQQRTPPPANQTVVQVSERIEAVSSDRPEEIIALLHELFEGQNEP